MSSPWINEGMGKASGVRMEHIPYRTIFQTLSMQDNYRIFVFFDIICRGYPSYWSCLKHYYLLDTLKDLTIFYYIGRF